MESRVIRRRIRRVSVAKTGFDRVKYRLEGSLEALNFELGPVDVLVESERFRQPRKSRRTCSKNEQSQ